MILGLNIKKLVPTRFMLIVLGLTLGVLTLLFNLCCDRFFIVKFQTELQKDTLIQVFYTLREKDAFNAKLSVKQLVKAGQHEISMRLPISKIAKFRLDFEKDAGKVEISDLQIEGRSVVKFDDFSKFSFKNISQYQISDHKLSFISSHKKTYIIYNEDLKLKSIMSFDFYTLIILVILYFLILYKIIKYLPHFKIDNHYDWIDIVFLAVFFTLLFMPMSHISDAEKSIQENRMLAKYKPIFKDNKFNLNFGRDFDEWFSDRFRGREIIIKFVSNLMYHLSSIYSNKQAIYIEDTGWMFNLPLIDEPLSESEITEINETIRKFDKFLEDHGIKFYVLLVPKKESIYQSELFDYGYDFQQDENFQLSIQRIIASDAKKQIIYPYQELMNAKQDDYVFFKQAHHWTDWGAYQGYKKLMTRIKSDFPDIYVASLDEYNEFISSRIREDWYRNFGTGHTVNLLNLRGQADEILTTVYKYYNNKNQTVTEERQEYIKKFFNENGKYRIFLTGNSQNEDLLQFLPYSAKELKYLRLNKEQLSNKEEFKFMKYYQKELLEFDPDIVVFAVSVGIFSKITDFYKD